MSASCEVIPANSLRQPHRPWAKGVDGFGGEFSPRVEVDLRSSRRRKGHKEPTRGGSSLVVASQGCSDADFPGPTLSAMNTSLRGNCSNCEAGLPKLVASTSGGLPAIHSDRSISS